MKNRIHPFEKISGVRKKFLKYFLHGSFAVILMLTGFTNANASDYYWVGGTGNWSDYATHWATTSGGVIFYTTIPSPNDDVFFDLNSFLTSGDTVYLDTTATYCNNMDWTGAMNNPVFRPYTNSNLSIYGSLTLSSNMTWNSVPINFEATTAGHTILSAGVALSNLSFNGTGGWTLTDSLTCGQLGMNKGTFNTNNQPVTCGDIYISGSNNNNVSLGTSVITCQGWSSGGCNSSNVTIAASAATFIITQFDFSGGTGYEYGDIYAGPFSLGFDAGTNNKYHNIISSGNLYTFGVNNTDTIENLIAYNGADIV